MHSLTRNAPPATRSQPSVHVHVHLHEKSESRVWLAVHGQPMAVFVLTDQIRATSFSAMHSLRALGINVELLTGDRPEAAASVAQELGITKVEAGVKPEGKADRIRQLRASTQGLVAMAGDGTIVATDPSKETEALTLAASLASSSLHPLSRALVHAALSRKLSLQTISDIHDVPGQGISGKTSSGQAVVLGNPAFLKTHGIDLTKESFTSDVHVHDKNESRVYLARNSEPMAVFVLTDQIRATSFPAMHSLRALGINVELLTGDRPEAADAVAKELGITKVESGVKPEDKADLVRQLRSSTKGLVAMAGDGTNDAPALASADLGISLGSGTDAAKEASAVVVLKGDLAGVARAFFLGRATVRTIWQNLAWAFGYNLFALPAAAGLFLPLFGWALNPTWAAGSMALSCVFLTVNALRLLRFSPKN